MPSDSKINVNFLKTNDIYFFIYSTIIDWLFNFVQGRMLGIEEVTTINKVKGLRGQFSGTRGQRKQETQNGQFCHGNLVQICYDSWFSGPEWVILIPVFWLPEQWLSGSCCVTASVRYSRQSRNRTSKLGTQRHSQNSQFKGWKKKEKREHPESPSRMVILCSPHGYSPLLCEFLFILSKDCWIFESLWEASLGLLFVPSLCKLKNHLLGIHCG